MKRLYYLRHGQSEMNLAGLFAGATDTPLTKKGQDGALLAGKQAKTIEIDVIISSPLSRALDTAKLFAKGSDLPVAMIETNPLLRERNFGSLENTTYSRAVSSSLFNDNLPDGVESWDDMIKRARELLDYVNRLPVDNVLLVGHGAIGRALRSIIEPTADIHAGIPNSELVRWL